LNATMSCLRSEGMEIQLVVVSSRWWWRWGMGKHPCKYSSQGV